MTKHGIDLDSESIRAFCRKWRIKELWVFGSILRDDFSPDSDIDFLVTYKPKTAWDAFQHMDMEDELGAILGRKVDVVGRGAVERSRNRFRKSHILSTAEPVIAQG